MVDEVRTTVDTTGIYRVVITNRNTGCSAESELLVRYFEPAIEEIQIMGLSCQNLTAEVTILPDLGNGSAPVGYILDDLISEEGFFTGPCAWTL